MRILLLSALACLLGSLLAAMSIPLPPAPLEDGASVAHTALEDGWTRREFVPWRG